MYSRRKSAFIDFGRADFVIFGGGVAAVLGGEVAVSAPVFDGEAEVCAVPEGPGCPSFSDAMMVSGF